MVILKLTRHPAIGNKPVHRVLVEESTRGQKVAYSYERVASEKYVCCSSGRLAPVFSDKYLFYHNLF